MHSSPFWSSLSPLVGGGSGSGATPLPAAASERRRRPALTHSHASRSPFGHKLDFEEHDGEANMDGGEERDRGREQSARRCSPSVPAPASRLRLKHQRIDSLADDDDADDDQENERRGKHKHAGGEMSPPRVHGTRGSARLAALSHSPAIPSLHSLHLLPLSPAVRSPMLGRTRSSGGGSGTGQSSDGDGEGEDASAASASVDSPLRPLASLSSAASSSSAAAYLSPQRSSDCTPFSTPNFSPAIGTPRAPSAVSTPLTAQRQSYRLRSAQPSSALNNAYALASPAMFSPAPSGMTVLGGRSARQHASLDSPVGHTFLPHRRSHALNADGTQPAAHSTHSTAAARANLLPHTASTRSPLLLGMTGSPSVSAPLLSHSSGGAAMLADSAALHPPPSPKGDAVTVNTEPVRERGGGLGDTSSVDFVKDESINLSTVAETTQPPPTIPSISHFPFPSAAAVAASAASSMAAALAPTLSAAAASAAAGVAAASHKPCNCKKSKCLKLYCECFARQDFCRGCNCVGCFNTPDATNQSSRDKAIVATMERDPQAFFRAQLQHSQLQQQSQMQAPSVPVIEALQSVVKQEAVVSPLQPQAPLSTLPLPPHALPSAKPSLFTSLHGPKAFRKGCHCKKSECLKKYCECFQNGLECTSACKCVDCKNGHADGAACGEDRGKKRPQANRKNNKMSFQAPMHGMNMGGGGGLVGGMGGLPSLQHAFSQSELFALHASLNPHMLPLFTSEALLAHFNLTLQTQTSAHQAALAAAAVAAAAAAAAASSAALTSTPLTVSPVKTTSSVPSSSQPGGALNPLLSSPVSAAPSAAALQGLLSTPVAPTSSGATLASPSVPSSSVASTTGAGVMLPDSRSPSSSGPPVSSPPQQQRSASKRSQRASASKAAAGLLADAPVVKAAGKHARTRLASTLDKLPSARGGALGTDLSHDQSRAESQSGGDGGGGGGGRPRAGSSPNASSTDDEVATLHRQKRARHVPLHLSDMQLS